MTDPKIIISPKTKVGELLHNYPELESVFKEFVRYQQGNKLSGFPM